MAYEAQTKEAIHQRMLDASPSDIDKRQGSVTYDLTGPVAIELEGVYLELDTLLDKGFADTAYGEYLDRRVAERGLVRKPSVKSVGQLTFTSANGTSVPIGTQATTGGESPVYFVTTTAGTISGGSVTVTAEARDGGANGNVAIGAITQVIGDLSGVVTVTNAAMFDGGVDTESDAALLSRYLDIVRKPITSGNANHYRTWALEIAGIADAKVYPVWNGNGTVKVVLLDTDKTAPDAAKVLEVANYIESLRPVGAQVTVIAAPEVAINVTVTVTLKSGATKTQAQTQITDGLREYLKTLAFADPVVRYSRIANVILDADAVLDYSNLTVNGGTTNLTIADGSVGVNGTVAVT